METSGSTGAPETGACSRAAPCSRPSTRPLVGWATPGRGCSRCPPSYVAGVQVVCRSLSAGHEPLLLDETGSVAGGVAAGARFLSLVPTQLHRLLDDAAEAEALAALHTVLLGGGPIDPALRARAEAAGVHLVATYGSAETAGGCVYDGYPLDGVALVIGADGRIRIGGPTLFDGYDGDQAADRRRPGRRVVPHLRRRSARRRRPAARARPPRRRRRHRWRERARARRSPLACASTPPSRRPRWSAYRTRSGATGWSRSSSGTSPSTRRATGWARRIRARGRRARWSWSTRCRCSPTARSTGCASQDLA